MYMMTCDIMLHISDSIPICRHIFLSLYNEDVVNALCCHRADVNYRAKDGATPLLITAEFGEFNVSWLC